MIKNRLRISLNLFLCLAMVLCFSLPSFAGNLNIKYEQVVTDEYGNELGYQTKTIKKIDDLPPGSPWRNYLNTKLANGKTIYEYATSISKSLSQDFNLNLSDRESNSYAYKSSTNGSYNLNIYTYVNDFGSESSKTYLFMHEFGHIVMLNSYPKNYNFGNLDYGSDNKHYLHEVLPNYNTAWVEGWADGFAAANNNGLVFGYDLKQSDSLDCLKGYTFEEMTRNELFVAKVLYDSFKDISGGQAAAYDVFARTGPHYSLYEFCNKYVASYPENKVGLAKILVENSYGKISLKELLTYVNGGSYTVSRDLYNYLQSAGMLNGTATNNYASNSKPTTTTSNSKPSLFTRIANFFKKLFGKTEEVVSSPSSTTGIAMNPVVTNDEALYNRYTDGAISISGSMDAPNRVNSAVIEDLAYDSNLDALSIEEVQKEYTKYYNEYKELVSAPNPDEKRVNEIRYKMVEAKRKLNKLQGK